MFVVFLAMGCNTREAPVIVQNGDHRLVWEKGPNGWSAYVEHDGTRVGTLPDPFDYRIAEGQNVVKCVAKAATVRQTGIDSATAEASLNCENGARLLSRIRVEAARDMEGAFILRLHTRALNARGDGLAQQMQFFRSADPAAEALIPGVWYKRNEHVEDCGPGLGGATAFHVREDRGSYPAVSLRSGGESLTLMREQSAAYDHAPRSDASPASLLVAGNALYSKRTGGTDISGVGFDLAAGAPSVTLHYPYYEGPYSMQLRVYAAEATPLFDSYCRYQSARGFVDWELVAQTGLESSWRLIAAPHAEFGTLLRDQWRWAQTLYRPAKRVPRAAAAEVRGALAEFVAARYDHSSSLAGFYYVMSVPSGAVLVPFFEPGFTGRAFLNARLLLQEGRASARPEWVAMAESVYDTWITAGTQGGAFYDLWDASNDKPGNDRSINEPPEGFAIRREAESLWALIDAVRDEQEQGVSRDVWKLAARVHLDLLVSLAQPDGSYCRRYTFTKRCLDPNPGGTSAVIPALVHGYRMFGDARYLKSAKAAAQVVAEQFITPSDYFASTIDNPSENKEAATYAAYAARLLCEEECDKDDRWRDLAQKAADAALTWIQFTDVPFYEPTQLAQIGMLTRGLGNVAAGGGNADAYAFEFPATLVWLAEESGDPKYREMAQLILGAAMDTVPVPGNLKGLGQVGMAPEGIQKTTFSYFMGGKGSYAPFSALGWTTASVFEAMDEIERDTGLSVDAFLRE